MRPVTTTSFAKMAWLREVVVVVVTELCVGRVTAWATEVFWFRRWCSDLGLFCWSLSACIRWHCYFLCAAHQMFDQMTDRNFLS